MDQTQSRTPADAQSTATQCCFGTVGRALKRNVAIAVLHAALQHSNSYQITLCSQWSPELIPEHKDKNKQTLTKHRPVVSIYDHQHNSTQH